VDSNLPEVCVSGFCFLYQMPPGLRYVPDVTNIEAKHLNSTQMRGLQKVIKTSNIKN